MGFIQVLDRLNQLLLSGSDGDGFGEDSVGLQGQVPVVGGSHSEVNELHGDSSGRLAARVSVPITWGLKK